MRQWNLLGVVLTSFLLGMFGLYQNGLASERYAVKPGDTLLKVSKMFRVPVKKLKEANHLESESLRPKQVLLIPVIGKNGNPPAAAAAYCIVKRGESLSSISKRTGVSVGEIKSLNQLRSGSLKSGQKLILQRPKPEPAEEIEEAGDVEEAIDPAPLDKGTEKNQESLPKWSSSEERSLFIRVVKNFLGVPYRLGGSTLKGIDCSGFVKKIYEIFNTTLPRTAREQFRFGKSIGKEQLQEGDLVFFNSRRSSISHVGIYIGNKEFVHASSQDRQVKVDNLDMPYFKERFLTGVRVKELEM